MEPVGRFQHLKPGLANEWKKSRFGIAGEVMVDVVMIGPSEFVGRNRENQGSMVLE